MVRQTADSGVQWFDFISSIGVNGDQSTCPFSESDDLNPIRLYATSKQEAESGWCLLTEQTVMEIVIIRPLLFMGPRHLAILFL